MPTADNNPSVPIAAGRLSKVIEFSTKVPPADYYGFSINYGGGILNEDEIRTIAQRGELLPREKIDN